MVKASLPQINYYRLNEKTRPLGNLSNLLARARNIGTRWGTTYLLPRCDPPELLFVYGDMEEGFESMQILK